MLELTPDMLHASGSSRHCYRHPHDDSACVKVDRPNIRKSYTLNEINFFRRIGNWRDVANLKASSGFLGTEETNLGLGAEYRLIRNETDGKVSATLYDVLHRDPAPFSTEVLDAALVDFRKRLLADAVMAKDLRPWNICVQVLKDQSIRFWLVDGFGHRTRFRLKDYIAFFGRRKLREYMRNVHLTSIDDVRKAYPPGLSH